MSEGDTLTDKELYYAFSVAVSNHLEHVEKVKRSEPFAAGQTDDVPIRFILNEMRSTRMFGLNQIRAFLVDSRDYSEVTLVKSKSALKLEWYLVGPPLPSFDVPSKHQTDKIIEKIEDDEEGDDDSFGSRSTEYEWPPKDVFARSEQLSDRLYEILKQAVRSTRDAKGIIDDEKSNKIDADTTKAEFDSLSIVCSDYLRFFVETYSSQLDFNDALLETIHTSASFLNPKATREIDLQNVRRVFNGLIKFSIKSLTLDQPDSRSNTKLVNKLREQGNNLMSNMAFAQAIKIYTNALDFAKMASLEAVPQLLTNRAIAFIGLNCFPEAIDDLNHAVSIDHAFTPAWTQLGYCHLYMGNGLIALKSYLIALRSAVGEIFPVNFPDDDTLRENYKTTKIKTVLPQFVQRLCQSISLTEKRAYQQYEPASEIRKTVSEVRRILATLRAEGSEADRDYFTYFPNLRESGLRNVSERANRTRPNILTQEVSQNMLANTGMEAVPIPRESIDLAGRPTNNTNNVNVNRNTTTTNQRNPVPIPQPSAARAAADMALAAARAAGNAVANSNNQPPTVRVEIGRPTAHVHAPEDRDDNEGSEVDPPIAQPAPGAPPGGIRDFLNDFGELIDGRAPNASGNRTANDSNGTQPARANVSEGIFRDVLDGLGSMITQFSGNGMERVYINGQEVIPPNRSGTNANGEPQGPRQNQRDARDEDIDMPDDLD
ncbi:uncharacterized protein RJT20DRAFT_126356 [Scheffersomyces xylosifermentans]|uniref:uncharacterized protein n=1 Tax=Scheffersomyces xylosifermentans TaxID=1304137 RepID=UPI00315D0436